MFLSRALFTSRQCLGIVGDEATRIFSTSSGIAKKISNTIHIIGKLIANHQFSCARGDVHSIGVDGGLIELIDSVEYACRQQFYILSQQKM
jgi:hypothetical protein